MPLMAVPHNGLVLRLWCADFTGSCLSGRLEMRTAFGGIQMVTYGSASSSAEMREGNDFSGACPWTASAAQKKAGSTGSSSIAPRAPCVPENRKRFGLCKKDGLTTRATSRPLGYGVLTARMPARGRNPRGCRSERTKRHPMMRQRPRFNFRTTRYPVGTESATPTTQKS